MAHHPSRKRRRVLRPAQVRGANAALVLGLLRQHQRLSRAELARRSGLSEGAISRITAELLARGLIVQEGAENSTGGRPAIRLRLDDSRYFTVGVEIGNWETRLALGTLAGNLVEVRCMRTPPAPAETIELVASEARLLKKSLGGAKLWGIGVAVRGLVNSETGIVELGNDPGWVRVPLREELERATGVPVWVENDVRAAALAEFHLSAELQAIHCLLFVKIAEGIGTGIVLDGRLHCGSHMAAGEFGQMVIHPDPGLERHDRPGCLEKLASNLALCERYQQLAGGRRRPVAGDGSSQVRRICHLAMEGDQAARQALEETCRFLGLGLANLVWLFDPDVIVLDGAITDAWPLVHAAIRQEFPNAQEFRNFQGLVLRPSSLGGEATMRGAVSLPFAPLFAGDEQVPIH